MKKKKAAGTQKDLPKPGKQYPGVHGKIVDWAEHVFEEGMTYVRVRFTDKTELRVSSGGLNCFTARREPPAFEVRVPAATALR
jgi:hypothetical protein